MWRWYWNSTTSAYVPFSTPSLFLQIIIKSSYITVSHFSSIGGELIGIHRCDEFYEQHGGLYLQRLTRFLKSSTYLLFVSGLQTLNFFFHRSSQNKIYNQNNIIILIFRCVDMHLLPLLLSSSILDFNETLYFTLQMRKCASFRTYFQVRSLTSTNDLKQHTFVNRYKWKEMTLFL